MEHRNRTVIPSPAAIARARARVVDPLAHEFFHCWNVERIRRQGLEPFDFDRANLSGELWLAEGFTQYYGPLVLQRASLISLGETTATLTNLIASVAEHPGHLMRSAEEISRMWPLIDGRRTVDHTNSD